jgi:PAS domain S-box-containing protein
MDQSNPDTLLRLFVDTLPDCAVILLDTNGNMISWSAGAQTLLGYAPHEVVGQPYSTLLPQEDVAAGVHLASLAAALSHGRHREATRRLTKGGGVIDVTSALTPLYDAQKKLLGFGNMIDASASARRPAALPAALGALAPGGRAPRKILVVDDDDNVREMVLLQLKSLGYTALPAATGTEALEILARVADIDLLFTDVVMPGDLNGREVADEARKLRPNLKVLFTSGYFEGALVREGALESRVRLLVKPYRKKDLALSVEEVLASPA